MAWMSSKTASKPRPDQRIRRFTPSTPQRYAYILTILTDQLFSEYTPPAFHQPSPAAPEPYAGPQSKPLVHNWCMREYIVTTDATGPTLTGHLPPIPSTSRL